MANSSNYADMDLYVPTPEEIEQSMLRARKLRAEYIASLFRRSATVAKEQPVRGAAAA